MTLLAVAMMLIAALSTGCSSTRESNSVNVQPEPATAGQFSSSSGAVSYDSANRAKISTSVSESKADTNNAGSDAAVQREAGNVDAKNVAGLADESAGAPKQAGGGFTSNESSMNPDTLDRKLIYHANMTMEVKDYARTQSEIRDMVALAGGYVLQFSDNQSLHELGGSFTLKIPANGFFSFIQELEKLKPISLQRNMQGQDVTEEYVDLSARLKAKQVVEARLMSFMEKATKADDLVKFSDQLGNVQVEIEQLKGRMRYIDQSVAYSTVELRLYQRLKDQPETLKPQEVSPVLERAWDAMKASGHFVYEMLVGLIVLVSGALPVLVLLVVISVPFAVWYRNRSRKKRFAAETSDNTRNNVEDPLS